MRSSVVVALALCIATLVGAIAAPPARARARVHARPSVTLIAPKRVERGTPLVFTWKAKHLKRGHVLELQRRVSRRWSKVKRLPRRASGTSRVTFRAAGTYRLRLVIRMRHGAILAQRARTLRVVPRPAPSVTFAVTDADIGAAVPFSWGVQGVRSGDRLAVQSRVGTTGRWSTVLEPSVAEAGSGTLAAYSQLGRYTMRLVVTDRSGAVIGSAQSTFAVWGDVPLGTLLQRSATTKVFPTFSFESVIDAINVYPGLNTLGTSTIALAVEPGASPCRSVHVDFAVKRPGDWISGTLTATASIVQSRRSAVSASAVQDQRGSVDAELSPGDSWGINVASSHTADKGASTSVYFNGTAHCYSETLLEKS